jgi:hypothetical protein
MKLRFAFAVAAAFVSFGAVAGSTVQIHNTSAWNIHELYISPTSEEEWGGDLLGDQIVQTGQYAELGNVPCDDYDVRIVDEDGDVCVVSEVTLCESAAYTLDDDDLLNCEASTEE